MALAFDSLRGAETSGSSPRLLRRLQFLTLFATALRALDFAKLPMLQEAQANKFDLWKEDKAGTSVILATLLRQSRITKNGAWREHYKQGGR
jgi:hypothetical protein